MHRFKLDEKSRDTLERIRLIEEIQYEVPSVPFSDIFDLVNKNPALPKYSLRAKLREASRKHLRLVI